MHFNKYFSIAKHEVGEAIVDNKCLIILMAGVYLISLFGSGFFSLNYCVLLVLKLM